MFFSDINALQQLALRSGFSVFILPPEYFAAPLTKKPVKTASGKSLPAFPPDTLEVVPNEKNQIAIDQVRPLIDAMTIKETKDRFFVIRRADLMNPAAQNAVLKLLEEPKEHYHLVFLAVQPGALLPTVLSRAAVYVLKQENPLDQPLSASDDIKSLAKQFISANSRTLGGIIETLTDKKQKDVRTHVLEILDAAIELLYKSYFLTNNPQLLKKLPQFLEVREAISRNGHVKLQLYAGLV